jgi:hypothetical protein
LVAKVYDTPLDNKEEGIVAGGNTEKEEFRND